MYNPGQELSSLNFGAIIGGPLKAVVEAQAQAAHTTVDFVKSVGFEEGQPTEEGKSSFSGKPIYVSFKYPKEIAPFVPAVGEKLTITVDVSGGGYKQNGETIIDSINVGADTTKPLSLDKFTIEYGDNGEIKSIEIIDITADVKDLFKNKATQNLTIKLKAGQTPTSPAKLTATYRKAMESSPAVYQDMQIEVPILTMMPIPYLKIQYADIELNVKINSVSNTSNQNESNTKIDSKTTASASFGLFSKFKAQTELNASYSNQSKSASSEEVKKDYSLNIKIHAAESEMPAGMSKILDILEASIVNTPALATTV